MQLPQEFLGWKTDGADQVFTRQTIFDYMDGGGEIYLGYDFRRLDEREYAKPGAPRIIAEVYSMGSSEDAYGIFSHDTDGQPVDIGLGALYSAGLLRFWKDRYFVRLQPEDETPEVKAAVMALGKQIAEQIPQAGSPPALLQALPPAGLISSSVHYFHTAVSLNIHYFIDNANLLNLNARTEALLAQYQQSNDKPRLLIIRYPSSGEARTALDQFTTAYLKETPTGREILRPVEKGLFVGGRQVDRTLLLVFEAGSPDSAEHLLELAAAKMKGVAP